MVCSIIGAEGGTPPPPPAQLLFLQRRRPLQQPPTPRLRPAPPLPEKEEGWDSVLRRISNSASALCVLDCTLLPLVTLVLSVVSASTSSTTGAASSPLIAWLLHTVHELGHGLALYFVLPVGLLTTLVNHHQSQHRRSGWWWTVSSLLGLVCVGVANGGFSVGATAAAGCLHAAHHHAAEHGVVSAAAAASSAPWHLLLYHHYPWVDQFLHAVQQEGILHRIVNLLGCGLLLAGNQLSKRGRLSGNDELCPNPNCKAC